MKIKFTKMHGLGNDFVVLDAINQSIILSEQQIRDLANRHFGIGCDQILFVEKPSQPGVDFRYRIFNADGGEVEQCGNGARCFARYVHDKKLTKKQCIHVETSSGTIILYMNEDQRVRVDMGAPHLTPADIPLDYDQKTASYNLSFNGERIVFGAVSMGNPHAVIKVDDVLMTPVETLGAALESHAIFPERANIGFMQILHRNHIRLRVHERGVGETRACGTGACAAVVIGRLWGELDEDVTVSLPGGDLQIEWFGDNENVFLTGPASHVFDGEFELADLSQHGHDF